DRFDVTVLARLLQREPHIFNHRIAHRAGNRRTDETAERDQRDSVRRQFSAALDNNFPKARHWLFHSDTAAAETAKSREREQEINEHSGAERDEQKNSQTTNFAISHECRLKVVESSRAHKRFSAGKTRP